MANFFREHQNAIIGGGVAIVLGFLSKFVIKKEIFPVSNGPRISLTFLSVSLAGIIANEIRKVHEF